MYLPETPNFCYVLYIKRRSRTSSLSIVVRMTLFSAMDNSLNQFLIILNLVASFDEAKNFVKQIRILTDLITFQTRKDI